MNRTRTLKLAAPLVGLALALSACGGSTETATPTTSATQDSAQGISTQFNDADQAFIKDMSPHHSGALAMAELAPTRAGNADVKAIAAQISAAQEPEIERMKAMGEVWKVDLAGGGGHSMGSTGGGMSMGGDDAAALTPLNGAAFDKEFLTRMIAHHTSAIVMSETELADGKNPQGKELAEQIIAAQKTEITKMTALLTQL